MSDTPLEAQTVHLLLQEPGGTPYDMRGDFGLLLVRQDQGTFTLVAGSGTKLSEEAFGDALSQALLVFIKATAAHPGVSEKVRQVAKLISADLEVVDEPRGEPQATENPAPVTCEVRGEDLIESPPPIEGDFVVACARQGLRFSVVKAPAPDLSDPDCGRAFAGAWVALTQALADDSTVAPHVRKWARGIIEEFTLSGQRAQKVDRSSGPN